MNPVRSIKGKGLNEYEIWLRKKQRQTITLCREHHLEAEKLYRQKSSGLKVVNRRVLKTKVLS